MPESRRRGIFAWIGSRQDALNVVTDASIVFLLVAAILAGLYLMEGERTLLDVGLFGFLGGLRNMNCAGYQHFTDALAGRHDGISRFEAFRREEAPGDAGDQRAVERRVTINHQIESSHRGHYV